MEKTTKLSDCVVIVIIFIDHLNPRTENWVQQISLLSVNQRSKGDDNNNNNIINNNNNDILKNNNNNNYYYYYYYYN